MLIQDLTKKIRLKLKKGNLENNSKLNIFLNKICFWKNNYYDIETYNNFPTSCGINSSCEKS